MQDELECGCVEMRVGGDQVVRVSPEDLGRFARYRWHVNERGYVVRFIRYSDTGRRHPLYMHRLAIRVSNGQYIHKLVDHVDGDRAHNGRHNLRPASAAQNMWNRRKAKAACSSQFKGVTLRNQLPVKRWQARICFEGRVYSLGYYASEEEAARAYDKAALEMFGRYARPNFKEVREA
jgi:hypothetical protein